LQGRRPSSPTRAPRTGRASARARPSLVPFSPLGYPGGIPATRSRLMRTPAALACLVALLAAAPAARAADDPSKVFEERILPIFKSPDPSSCVRCHLAAVDLKSYILPSAKDTFLALRDQGLIDLDKPEESKILKLINRGAGDPKAAGLIT